MRRGNLTGRPDLFVMTAAGTGRTRLTTTPVPERDPSWSPTGARIVYSARTHATGPFRIFVAKADGSGRAQLTTQTAGTADRAPAWSPDGTRIAFISDRDGGFPELYLMNANGSGIDRLTSNGFVDGNPSWSPDGTRLVFERCCKNGTSDLFSLDLLTGTETNLTASTSHQDFDPAWSPDGTRIAYVSFEVGQGNVDVWVMNADGSAQTRLTQEAGLDTSPDWQPLPTCTITGTDGVDDLLGTEGNDVICALAGHDEVSAGGGHDLVNGDRGNDVVEGQDGEDLLLGEGGDDTLGGGARLRRDRRGSRDRHLQRGSRRSPPPPLRALTSAGFSVRRTASRYRQVEPIRHPEVDRALSRAEQLRPSRRHQVQEVGPYLEVVSGPHPAERVGEEQRLARDRRGVRALACATGGGRTGPRHRLERGSGRRRASRCRRPAAGRSCSRGGTRATRRSCRGRVRRRPRGSTRA